MSINRPLTQVQPYWNNSMAIRQEIQRFESVHPSIYAIYDLIESIPDPVLGQQIRDHVVCIEDSFVNSQEWTLSRAVPDLRLGIVGSLASGKSALVHRYLTGSYMQEESPEGGRFKKEISIDGQSYLLLIRDEGGSPELQFTAWVDAVIFVFSLESEASFNAIYSYHAKMAQFRNASEIPFILVGTQDGINETNPRVVDEARARKLASDLRRCSYYETCATYGLNIERVFQDACQKIVQQRLTPLAPPSAGVVSGAAAQRPTTPNHYSLGRHYGQQQQQQQQHSTGSTTSITTGGGSSAAAAAGSSATPRRTNSNHNVTGNNSSTTSSGNSSTSNNSNNAAAAADKDGKDLPTPSSTPTTSRKSRRRSNLFTPSSSKKEDKEKSDKDKAKNSNGGGELGSGRAIPIKQGYLYKRSHNALNKDWKKKYVTLGDDGKLTYHSSLHDYMDDSHGKEISLQYVTVKVPGQKPRGSRGTQLQQQPAMAAVTSTPGVTTVMLTAYEVLKEPVTRILMGGGNGGAGGGDDPSSQNAINGGIADSSAKTETPSVKKRHRRMKSSSNKANDLDDCDGYEFQIVSLDNKIWHFEAASVEEREEWVTSIEHQILSSLQGNESSKSKSRMNSLVDAASIQSLRSTVIGNANCADCDAPNPDWASLNLGVLVCIECSGIHRNLGSHISRVRSLDLDEWPPGHIAVMLGLGNTLSNSIWEARMRGVKPGPQSSRDDKERWIRAKYEHKEFLALPSSSGSLGQQLIDAVCRSDLKTVALLLARAGPEDVNCSVAVRDLRTPLHLAATLGNLALVQLLLWHNANVKALDQEGRTCLTFARVSNSPEVIELLIANGCPEGPSSISSFSTLNRRKTINLTSTTNLMGKAEQGL
ncbi:hypothetical protein DAPPUDRAFT_44591 [Daphnia pulex]|uniref:Uncharacterized protein n=1 Tax=Daphnia pulex TaxID=6669 RepID=E9G1M5_DAPPU|nr:hypothetical protein DAPPUDRAFT_44591 [Daphnia pulex]|eukprot:EFX86787.1 hypothetical protein DAPPUDRAFT_44591 [Daphnia pulex]